jgi:S1-C subfamily serine protease
MRLCNRTLFILITLFPFIGSDAGAQSLADIYERVTSSVVEIRTVDKGVPTAPGVTAADIRGLGSGVLIGDGTLILTASHVVQTSETIGVKFENGEVAIARVVGSDHIADVALLRIPDGAPDGIRPASLGNSDNVRVGDRVFVIGAPLGLSHSMTAGFISATRPGESSLPSLVDARLLQTDAAINQGNSGGPMFNMDGEVIGIVSHLVTRTGDNSGLGFAVASNTVRELLIDRQAFWSGSTGVLATGDLARALNIPGGRPGLLVEKVAAGSPADALGLRAGDVKARVLNKDLVLGGDIILEIFELAVGPPENHEQFRLRINDLQAGDSVRMLLLRDGEVVEHVGVLPAR